MSFPPNCTIATCDPSESFYGYRPNLGIDVFFAIVYTAVISYSLYIVFRKKSWLGYTIALIIGSLLELIGYASRIYGYADPFITDGWIAQYTSLTLAPVFMSASIYVCIGQLADYLGRGRFNIRPRLYTRIFIPSDIFALVIQSSGGGISITERSAQNGGVTTGQGIIIGGLSLQVISLTIFFVLFLGVISPTDLFQSRRLRKLTGRDKRVRTFVILISVAILLIIGRSIFRTIEFSQGVFGKLGHNEILFIILDGFPVAIATSILALYHPVYCIPSTPRGADSQELGTLAEDGRYRPVSA
ncbi:RTA1-domain-containing protein [Xylariaceae sp. FL0594]|nr:RTA1-domain-containing protein [Xylariaceae sp. FL0594]